MSIGMESNKTVTNAADPSPENYVILNDSIQRSHDIFIVVFSSRLLDNENDKLFNNSRSPRK